MRSVEELTRVVESAWIDDEVFALRPDYQTVLIAVDGLVPGASDEISESFLSAAELVAAQALSENSIEELPHIASWREAFVAFGAKPQRTRNSVEALMRRVESGLPRINRLTDIYNAISIKYQIPIGGEDLSAYVGVPHLIRATGAEPFDTVDGGEPIVEFAPAGEVVWCDDDGITCRRWNWRQCKRTQLSESTTSALFILDILNPLTSAEAQVAANELLSALRETSADLIYATRIINK